MNRRDSDSSDDNIQLHRHIAEGRTHGGYERVTAGNGGGDGGRGAHGPDDEGRAKNVSQDVS
jgi:hypothetical protein